jgi:hypothetical protein
MAEVPAEETIMFAKIDLSDGFWRMLVAETDKWNFAYVLPDVAGEPTKIVIPHALQMGWTESPGYFCAATETGRDILQALIDGGTALPPHVMEQFMAPEVPARRQSSPDTQRKWQMSAVYVDDYILAAVEDRTGTTLQRARPSGAAHYPRPFSCPEQIWTPRRQRPYLPKETACGDARWAPTQGTAGFCVRRPCAHGPPHPTQSPSYCNGHLCPPEKAPHNTPKIPVELWAGCGMWPPSYPRPAPCSPP